MINIIYNKEKEEMIMLMDQLTAAMDFMYNSVKETRLAHKAYHELSKLSDRELADLGLSRNDIVRVAYKLDQ
jgi:uncharacterized protein YjiS (DUF1127 family)